MSEPRTPFESRKIQDALAKSFMEEIADLVRRENAVYLDPNNTMTFQHGRRWESPANDLGGKSGEMEQHSVESTLAFPIDPRERAEECENVDDRLRAEAAALCGVKEIRVVLADIVETRWCVRPWLFQQDGGWYLQCKYGNKPLALDKGNVVFVKALKDVVGALVTLKEAAEAGELDHAISRAAQRTKKSEATPPISAGSKEYFQAANVCDMERSRSDIFLGA